MLEGNGGEGNRVAHRDYYEIERLEQRLEFQGPVPCAACESRFVLVEGEHCKACRKRRAAEQLKSEAVQFFMIWGGLTVGIAKLGQWLFGVASMTSLMVSGALAVVAYLLLQRALFELQFRLQHTRE